ncbi:bidirectional sugar transporter N3-like [Cynara cardunculus var. scolymus]|uniref:Bidirectional sugar transporter SWEET n=1 Tax=Cynara cardunculus var. scolymus TaxID=59895 RepID=A0A118JY17_CYNCS|nr:bidirectional sugar transporter N3-like [Cynara cardunculus var. scolymus]KVH97871.1 SWEET sugar transporter [Cynara cardunculus var. scolymus]
MEVFNVDHPLVFVFGLLGNIISTGVYFAPLPTFIEICKRKSTMGFQSFPYVVSLLSALLWLYYAFIKEGDTFLLISINSLGTFIESLYIIIFLLYATPNTKKQTFKGLSATLVFCLVISLGTLFTLQGETRVLVVGWVCVGISIAVFAAPLTIVFEVVRTQSVEFMPLPLSCFLTLSAMMWFAYGMSLKDICVTVPNILGFILGVVQMGVYAYYKKVASVSDKKPKDQHMMNILSANSEVHPVDSGRSSEADDDVVAAAVDDNEENKKEECVLVNVKQQSLDHIQLVICAT